MTTDGGGWTLIFKHSTGFQTNVLNEYLYGNMNNEKYLNKSKNGDISLKYFRENWSKYSQALIYVTKNNTVAKYMKYSLVGTSYTNFYSKSHLISSSWKDLMTEQQNFYSIYGDMYNNIYNNNRFFLINRIYAGCPNDTGWLVIVSKENDDACKGIWKYTNYGDIIYSNKDFYQNYTKGDVLLADAFMIFVKE